MTLTAAELVEVEALRDEGYSDAEIEAELGVKLNGFSVLPAAVRTRAREKKFEPRPPAPTLRPTWGEDGPEQVLSMVMLGKLAEEREEAVERFMGGAGRASRFRTVEGAISRGGLASQVAVEMARLRLGQEWHQLSKERRAAFVGMAVLAVEALEQVAA